MNKFQFLTVLCTKLKSSGFSFVFSLFFSSSFVLFPFYFLTRSRFRFLAHSLFFSSLWFSIIFVDLLNFQTMMKATAVQINTLSVFLLLNVCMRVRACVCVCAFDINKNKWNKKKFARRRPSVAITSFFSRELLLH